MMQAACLRARGGPEALECGRVPLPTPGDGEILVRVHAAAVTPSELLWVPTWTTRAGAPRPFPVIPGHEFSGTVHAVGPGTPVAAGAAVFGMNDWFRDGVQAEFCVARAADVVAKPPSVDHAHAAATPISALTAWQGLIERGRLAAGERVLIHGAAGAVGLFAVQVAKWRGAHVIATASAHNVAFVRELGADEVIDYRAQRFEDAAGAVDVVFDTVGGETLAHSWDLLGPSGRMVTIAAAGEQTQEPRVRDAFFIVEANAQQLAAVADMMAAGRLRAVVSQVFALADVRAAYEHKPVHGKAVLAIG